MIDTTDQLIFHKDILEKEQEEKLAMLKNLKEKLNNIKLSKEDERKNIIKIEDTLKWISNDNSYIEPHINDFVWEDK